MKKDFEQDRSRRELCFGALRYALLGLMAMGGAALFAKRRRLLEEGICLNDGICNGCRALAQCSLPQALLTKKNRAGVNHGG